MTSFVHVNFPAEHPGVARAESAMASVSAMGRGFALTKAFAAVMLAAVVATLLVVADKLVVSIADSGSLFASVVMWIVAFAAVLLFARAARNLSARLIAALDAWSHSIATARADERLWAFAQTDERVMRELQIAMVRAEPELAPLTVAVPAASVVETEAAAPISAKTSAVTSFLGGMFEAANMRLQRNSISYFM